MSVLCPACGKPMQASVTAKQGDRVFAMLVCEGPHDPKAVAVDPRAQYRPVRRESKPL